MIRAIRRIGPRVAILAAILLAVSACSKSKQTPFEAEEDAFMDVRAEISSVITDPDRAAEVLGIVDELETSFLAVRTNVQERRAKLRALNADYDATKEDFMALYDEARADMKSNGRTITAIHRRLVDSMTADEWDKVNKTQSKALNAALKSYRSI